MSFKVGNLARITWTVDTENPVVHGLITQISKDTKEAKLMFTDHKGTRERWFVISDLEVVNEAR